eukprot:scaffold3600_cov171-Amphora_coffeaeformis.AAC.13
MADLSLETRDNETTSSQDSPRIVITGGHRRLWPQVLPNEATSAISGRRDQHKSQRRNESERRRLPTTRCERWRCGTNFERFTFRRPTIAGQVKEKKKSFFHPRDVDISGIDHRHRRYHRLPELVTCPTVEFFYRTPKRDIGA